MCMWRCSGGLGYAYECRGCVIGVPIKKRRSGGLGCACGGVVVVMVVVVMMGVYVAHINKTLLPKLRYSHSRPLVARSGRAEGVRVDSVGIPPPLVRTRTARRLGSRKVASIEARGDVAPTRLLRRAHPPHRSPARARCALGAPDLRSGCTGCIPTPPGRVPSPQTKLDPFLRASTAP